MGKTSVKLIQSVERAVDILDCFDATCPSLTLNIISERTGLNINTTRGLVNTLVAKGLLLHDALSNEYHLGYYFMAKAKVIEQKASIYINMFRHEVDALSDKYHISASLQMVGQNQIYSIYCAYPSNNAYYIVLTEFTDLPRIATSSGKLLLAYNIMEQHPEALNNIKYEEFTPYTLKNKTELLKQLELIKKEKYSLELEEFNSDVGSLAVPVLNPEGELVATVSTTFFAKQLPKIKTNLLKDLKKIAKSMELKFN